MSLISIKLKKMCDKAVNTHLSAIQFIPECYKTQEMCDKLLIDVFLFLFLNGIKLKKCVTELFLKILYR